MPETHDEQTDLLIDIQKIIGADKPYEAVTLAEYIEHREAELRRQIADELAEMIRVAGNDVHSSTLNAYIEKLRGNK